MDAGCYEEAIVRRCAFLAAYHGHPSRKELDKAGLRLELGWLEGDARRWGVAREAIISGVLAELLGKYDTQTAHRLHGMFVEAFGRTPPAPSS